MLTVKQVAKRRKVTEQTVRRWCRVGAIECKTTPDGWAIPPKSLSGFKTPKLGRPKGRSRKC